MKYEIHQHKGFVEVVTHGNGDIELFQEILNEALKHPDWKPGVPILIDHSDLNADPITADGIERLASMINSSKDEFGASRMAIIVQGDLSYEFGRTWQVSMEDQWDGISEIFRSKEEAMDWLLRD